MRSRMVAGVAATIVTAGVALTAGAAPAAAAATIKYNNYVAGDIAGDVTVLDAASGRDVNTVSGHIYSGAGEVAIASDRRVAYIADEGHDSVSVVDIRYTNPGAQVAVGTDPHGVAIAPDREHVYVANWGSNTVSVMDFDTSTVIATVPVGTNPHGVAVAPDSRHVYVTTAGGVQVIDAATNAVTATVAAGTRPYGVAFTPDGTRAYVTDWGAGTVSVIDTATDKVSATVTVGTKPYDVAVTPDGTRAYVTNFGLGTVSVIDTATNTVTATVPAGSHPYGIDINPAGSRAYVTTGGASGTVVPIDIATNTAAAAIPLGHSALGIAVGLVEPTPPQADLEVSNPRDDGSINVSASVHTSLARITSYTYDFGDGTVVTQPTPDTGHAYRSGGDYLVRLTATDAYGQTSSSTQLVRLRPKPRTLILLADNLRYVTPGDNGAQPLVAGRAVAGAGEYIDMIDIGGGRWGLRSAANGRYLTLDANARLFAGGTNPDADPFEVVSGANGALSLRYVKTGKFVSSNNGAGPLTADRAAIGPWEQFHTAYQTNVTISAKANGAYITAEAGGSQPLIANRAQAGPWETFDLIDAGDGWAAIFAHANNRFVTAEAGGAQPLIANRTAVGEWERFKITINQDYYRSFQAGANGRYVTAEAAGAQPLIANRTAIGPWEKFQGFFA